jgi:hypothetical protein
MAVLDPAPSSSKEVAGREGGSGMGLEGEEVIEAISSEAAIAASVIRRLAQRLRD